MTDLPVTNSLAHISTLQPAFGPRFLMDENAAPTDAGGTIVREASTDTGQAISISQAARALQAARTKKQAAPEPAPAAEDNETPAESADDSATAENELSDEGNAAPGEDQATGETDTEQNPPAEKPEPLPLPRSWTKEQAKYWNDLPRATQEYLTAQAAKDSAEVRRVQNEAATQTKALTVKEEAAEQVRTQFETKLKSVVEVLEKEQLRDFPDIRSQADLDKIVNEATQLAAEAESLWDSDPLKAGQIQAKVIRLQTKLAAWDTHQRKLVAATHELTQADNRKAQQRADAWKTHIQAENKLAAEKIPDLADKTKGQVLMQRAAERLAELGFSQDELTKFSTGEDKISIYDHRLQQLIFSDLRLADILAAPKAVAKKPVPPVLRPGTPAPRGAENSERLKSLNQKLNTTGSLRDAAALLMARRSGRQQ